MRGNSNGSQGSSFRIGQPSSIKGRSNRLSADSSGRFGKELPNHFLIYLERLRRCPLQAVFLYCGLEIGTNAVLSEEGVGDREGSNLLSVLKVLTIKNFTLTFDCRSNDQRIVPGHLEPGSNPQRFPSIKPARSALQGVDETWSTNIVLRRHPSWALRSGEERH